MDLKKYRDLVSMGYIANVAAEALKQSNNDLNGALEFLYSKQSNGEIVSGALQNLLQHEASAAVPAQFNDQDQANSAMQQVCYMQIFPIQSKTVCFLF